MLCGRLAVVYIWNQSLLTEIDSNDGVQSPQCAKNQKRIDELEDGESVEDRTEWAADCSAIAELRVDDTWMSVADHSGVLGAAPRWTGIRSLVKSASGLAKGEYF